MEEINEARADLEQAAINYAEALAYENDPDPLSCSQETLDARAAVEAACIAFSAAMARYAIGLLR